jgi:MFS family permease
MLQWMSKDGRVLLLSRAIRGVGYGFLSVVLAIYLRLLGYDEVSIGILFTATLVSSVAFTILAGILERRVGRRRMLVLFAALMSAAGSIFVASTNYVALLLAALVGTINVTGGEVGPFLTVEQAMIPQTCSQERRTLAFAWYSVAGAIATSAGALVGGLPPFLQSRGISLLDSFRPVFLLYSLIGVATAILYLKLSRNVESPSSRRHGQSAQALLSPRSKRLIAKLSGLYALDSFGGGFVLQSIVSYWFYARFGASLEQISLIFFAAGLLTALSFLAAERLARAVGLVKTMVFTHLPSNVLLILVPLAPSLTGAMALYLARMSLSQMDVPTRQSYTVAIVRQEERVAAAGFTNVSRNLAQSISPSFSGYALQFVSLSFPFFIGGGLKIAYDIALYLSFRVLKPPEEFRPTDSDPEQQQPPAVEHGGASTGAAVGQPQPPERSPLTNER